jgi:putative PIN family toxin of toxin-antitoxin system
MSQVSKVVIDTNVLVAGLRSRRGASFLLLSKIGSDSFDIVLSVPLVLEYEDVLLRQIPSMGMRTGDVDVVLDYLCSIAELKKVFFLWRPFLPDPKDDLVLELAVAAGCSAIVTFNERDFRGTDKFGIQVLTPAAFLKEIGVL